MLANNSQAKTMKTIKLYSRPLCGWCQDAKAYLKKNNIPFESIDVDLKFGVGAERVHTFLGNCIGYKNFHNKLAD